MKQGFRLVMVEGWAAVSGGLVAPAAALKELRRRRQRKLNERMVAGLHSPGAPAWVTAIATVVLAAAALASAPAPAPQSSPSPAPEGRVSTEDYWARIAWEKALIDMQRQRLLLEREIQSVRDGSELTVPFSDSVSGWRAGG